MRVVRLCLLLAAAALLLGGCRFAVVESDSVRVEAPTAAPAAQTE